MNLREAIEQLERTIEVIRQVAVADDKTPLQNALALREEAALVDSGASEFEVVVFGDLNRFKGLNDEHGHDAGDVAINEVGEILHKIVVESLQAKAFRQSGDEFVILLKRDAVKKFLSKISLFAKIKFSHNEKWRCCINSYGDGSAGIFDVWQKREPNAPTVSVTGINITKLWSGVEA